MFAVAGMDRPHPHDLGRIEVAEQAEAHTLPAEGSRSKCQPFRAIRVPEIKDVHSPAGLDQERRDQRVVCADSAVSHNVVEIVGYQANRAGLVGCGAEAILGSLP